jgi:hypothetical protein
LIKQKDEISGYNQRSSGLDVEQGNKDLYRRGQLLFYLLDTKSQDVPRPADVIKKKAVSEVRACAFD